MNEVSERISQLMSRRRLSYGELAALTGIPKSALHRYVTGETEKIPMDRLSLIADALDCPASVLLGWTPEPEQSKDPVDAKIDEALQKLSKLNAENRAQAEKYLDFLLATQDTK